MNASKEKRRQAAIRLFRREAVAAGLKRSWANGAHHERFHCKPADEDTLRWRALNDRKGTPSPIPSAITIIHSMRRTDSYDVFLSGKLVCSGGRAKIGLFLGSLLP